jgi:signal peptidase I
MAFNDFDKEINIEENASYGVGGFFVEIVKIFFLALVIIIPIRVFIFQPFFVQGASMESSFEDGEYLIVNEIGYKKTEVGIEDMKIGTLRPFRKLERGDVIVFRYPKDPSQFYIKRVIGLAGETVEIKEGKVSIYNKQWPQGKILNETAYLDEDVITQVQDNPVLVKTVGEKEYFVMGDNRPNSSDSRVWGTINDTDVIGKVLLRAWPIERMHLYLQGVEYSI